MKALTPNSMIQNRYLVVQLIGKGGMGEVYLAVDQRLGSAVALKRTFFKEDETLGNAFEREARILARLRHPVLPKVIDHFTENGDQFLVMEHISGDDLASRLERAKKPFPLSWVMFWADQMLDALNYLHSHEPPIIHRDIKPQNLKLTDDNHIVLLDFGLSKDFDSNSGANSLNSASVAGYSPHFASMEQIRGTGTDARSDLYSLSATLYQLMTNTIPVDVLTRADALLGRGLDPIVSLSSLNPEISDSISDVILKGIGVRQDERFLNAAEMQKALRRAFNQPETPEVLTKERIETSGIAMDATLLMTAPPVKDEAITPEIETRISGTDNAARPEPEPKPEPPPEISKPSVTGAREGAAAAAAVSASAGVGVGGPPPLAFRPKSESQTETRRSSKKGLVVVGFVGLFLVAAVAAGAGWFVYSNYYVSKTTSTPVVEPSPSPSATVLADTSANVNTESQISDSNVSDTNSNQASATSKPPPITTRNPPPRAAQPPSAKSAPKPKPRDDRTVIEQ